MLIKTKLLSSAAIIAALMMACMFAEKAYASNCIVNAATDINFGTGNVGDLRYCIGLANSTPGSDVITFEITGTIALNGSLPAITDSLTIRGDNHQIVVDGQNRSGIVPFTISGGSVVAVTISDLTVTRGNGNNPDSGGIQVRGGALLDLANITIVNCTTLAENGGGLLASGSAVSLTNSHIMNNHMSAPGSAGSGISIEGGTFFMTGTTVSGNTLPNPDDIGGAGIHLFQVSLARIENSTINGNINGNYGAGIHNNISNLRMSNVTVSGNSGGLQAGGVSNVGGTIVLRNCTISGNTVSRFGGGIYNVGNAAALTLANTIVAGNSAPLGGPDIYNFAALTRAGTNIVQASIANSGTISGSGRIINVDPRLFPLVWNGGLVLTHALGNFSPARNAGITSEALDTLGAPLTFDARGPGFIRVRGSSVDVGAFESPTFRVGFDIVPDV